MRALPWLLFFGCGPQLDIGGCPLDGLDAVGEKCRDEGHQCYEFSLCDPCTTDMTQCEALECKDGLWAELALPTECTAG